MTLRHALAALGLGCLCLLPLGASQSGAQEAPAPSAAAVADGLEAALNAVTWDAPAADWRKSHPQAECHTSQADANWYNASDQWCSACSISAPSQATQSAFYAFRLEEAPVCRLGSFHAVAYKLPEATLRAALADLVARLTRRFGPAEEPKGNTLDESGSAFWHDIHRWQTQDRQVTLYLTDHPGVGVTLDLLARGLDLLAARAQDPRLRALIVPEGLHPDPELAEKIREEFPDAAQQLERQVFQDDDPALRAALVALLKGIPDAPPARQPLLLRAADELAAQLWTAGTQPLEWQKHREELSALGLTFNWNPLAGSWIYAHDLLWRLRDRYGNTPEGRRAFLDLEGMGWDSSGMCAEGVDQFKAVIQHATEFLAENPESPDRPQVLFDLARAYETWWSLSQAGQRDDYVQASTYQQGADEARTKAIAFYEQVRTQAPESDLAAYAARELPRLRLSIDTNQRYYYCVYD